MYDRFGEKIGVLRRGVWYGAEKEEKGAFREQGEGVLYYPSGQDTALAYLDGNGNLLTSLHKHVATIKRSRLPLLVLIVLCAALALLAVLLGALAVPAFGGAVCAHHLSDGRRGHALERTGRSFRVLQ